MNKKLMIKVCGMKDPDNAREVAELRPDYMGFVLYPLSPRYVSLTDAVSIAENIPCSIKKVAVIVNEPFGSACKIAESGTFDFLQLHGNEDIDYCSSLASRIGIIKAFSVSQFLPPELEAYLGFCDMFLFDTAGKVPGGSGKQFDHKILRNYTLNKRFILSGGISPEDSTYVKSIENDNIAAVDINSRFETEPGIKNISQLKNFIGKIREHETHN